MSDRFVELQSEKIIICSKNTFNFLFALTLSFNSFAAIFEIPEENRNYGSLPESMYAEADALFDSMETRVNSELPDTQNASKLVKNIANASVLSGTGVGADYSSPFDIAIVGFQSSLGVDLGNTKLSKITKEPQKTGGLAPQFGIMAGLNLAYLPSTNLGPLELDRFKLYVHYFSKNFKQNDFQLKSRSLGFHTQYQLLKPVNTMPLIRWHGVDITTGYRYHSIKGGTEFSINKSTTQDLSGFGSTTLQFSGLLDLDVNVTTHTIPIEASSAIRFLYSLFAYGGAGVDLAFGKSTTKGTLNNSSISATSGSSNISATALLNASASQNPQIANIKYFAGAGIEMGVLALYAQWHQSLTNDILGFAVGVKGFW